LRDALTTGGEGVGRKNLTRNLETQKRRTRGRIQKKNGTTKTERWREGLGPERGLGEGEGGR